MEHFRIIDFLPHPRPTKLQSPQDTLILGQSWEPQPPYNSDRNLCSLPPLNSGLFGLGWLVSWLDNLWPYGTYHNANCAYFSSQIKSLISWGPERRLLFSWVPSTKPHQQRALEWMLSQQRKLVQQKQSIKKQFRELPPMLPSSLAWKTTPRWTISLIREGGREITWGNSRGKTWPETRNSRKLRSQENSLGEKKGKRAEVPKEY